MSFVRGAPILAFVATAACAHHAKLAAKGATKGAVAQAAKIDPAFARTLGDQAARGAVDGTMAELASPEHRELIAAIADSTSQAAARGIVAALSANGDWLQQVVRRTTATAVGSFGQSLAQDGELRDELAAISHRMSTSAVEGARDAFGDVFPQCSGAANRRRCVEDQVGDLSRAAARGMMGGFLDAAKLPILGLAFLLGVLVTVLVALVRSSVGHGRAAAKHAG